MTNGNHEIFDDSFDDNFDDNFADIWDKDFSSFEDEFESVCNMTFDEKPPADEKPSADEKPPADGPADGFDEPLATPVAADGDKPFYGLPEPFMGQSTEPSMASVVDYPLYRIPDSWFITDWRGKKCDILYFDATNPFTAFVRGDRNKYSLQKDLDSSSAGWKKLSMNKTVLKIPRFLNCAEEGEYGGGLYGTELDVSLSLAVNGDFLPTKWLPILCGDGIIRGVPEEFCSVLRDTDWLSKRQPERGIQIYDTSINCPCAWDRVTSTLAYQAIVTGGLYMRNVCWPGFRSQRPEDIEKILYALTKQESTRIFDGEYYCGTYLWREPSQVISVDGKDKKIFNRSLYNPKVNFDIKKDEPVEMFMFHVTSKALEENINMTFLPLPEHLKDRPKVEINTEERRGRRRMEKSKYGWENMICKGAFSIFETSDPNFQGVNPNGLRAAFHNWRKSRPDVDWDIEIYNVTDDDIGETAYRVVRI